VVLSGEGTSIVGEELGLTGKPELTRAPPVFYKAFDKGELRSLDARYTSRYPLALSMMYFQ
jgi:hypothetical protein